MTRATAEQFNQITEWRKGDGIRCECCTAYVAATATLDPECPLHREPSAAEVEAFDLSGTDLDGAAARMAALVAASPAPTAEEG